MSSELSIISLIREASLVVQAVMLILALASVVSWTYIFSKYREIRRAVETSDEFEERFWSGIDLSDLYRELVHEDYGTEGMENIFLIGFKEFARLKQQGVAPEAVMEGAQRGMRVALSRELELLDEHLPFLATVGSTSPYIGLFGTVWGIMNSFRSLGAVKQATLAMVAPGISEALVATAMGLFAAIPAVMAYNRYSTDIGRLAEPLRSLHRGIPQRIAPAGPRAMNVSSRGGRGGRRKPMAEINVVPYIDVSLVLLIIFMITTPLLQTGVDVDLPKAESKAVDPGKDPPVVVTIKAAGELFVDVGDHKDVPVDKEGLREKVLSAVKDKPGRPVLIRGDQSVEYGKVIRVMASLKKAGVPSVGLMTQPEE